MCNGGVAHIMSLPLLLGSVIQSNKLSSAHPKVEICHCVLFHLEITEATVFEHQMRLSTDLCAQNFLLLLFWGSFLSLCPSESTLQKPFIYIVRLICLSSGLNIENAHTFTSQHVASRDHY